MKVLRHLIVIFISFNFGYSQESFKMESAKNKIVIPFKFVNNLIIIPIEVNGVKLNFLLDTGAEDTILFSLEEANDIVFQNPEKLQFVGFGFQEPFDGLKTSNNVVKVKDFVDKNHMIYIILDQEINISSIVGIPVNGILGYHFFKNHPVEINFSKNKIIVYKSIDKIPSKKLKKYQPIKMSIENNKPYVATSIGNQNEINFQAKLLLDTGNSDALWLFSNRNDSIQIPEKTLDDFLGKGFSGAVNGKRGRINFINFANETLKNVISTYPDSLSIKRIKMVENRVGSLGNEIVKRFNVIFDYSSQNLFLKKNSNFYEPFKFNMSGIEVQHEGLEWVNQSYEDNPTFGNNLFDSSGEKIANNLKFKFELKPSYTIYSVRKKSPGEIAGLKVGDKIISINYKKAYEFKLQQIIELLKSEEDEEVDMEIERKGKIIKVKLILKSLI